MNNQQWIDGSLTETDIDYQIAGISFLKKEEESYLVKGVELLCNQLSPDSVLEFGFGKGFTSTEFQRHGVTRHVILEPNTEIYQSALTWKANYSTDIEILNIFSWDYAGGETFNLVYNDIQQFTLDDNNKHESKMKSMLSDGQWYAGWATKTSGEKYDDYPIYFELDGTQYVQTLLKWNQPKRVVI